MDVLSRRKAVSTVGGGLVIAFVTFWTPTAANENKTRPDNAKRKAANDNSAAVKPVDADSHIDPVGGIDENAKALLDFIAKSEGTAGQAGGGYSTSLDYGKWLPGGTEWELTALTLDQIDALQTEMLSHPENAARYPGGGSSAIGRYQIVRRTLRGLRAQLNLRGDRLFDEALQNRLGLHLARQRGATRGLANEWASLKGKKLDKAIELAREAFGPRS